MKIISSALIISALFLAGCKKDKIEAAEERFAPTDVLVKIRKNYPIDQVFEFINSFNHDVENIHSQVYTSSLSPDSLQYVLDYLNNKTYTNDGTSWYVNGYLDAETNRITIFPRLFNMDDTSNQTDWLETMEFLELKEEVTSETAGCIIYFHVPEGQEKEWEVKFKSYDFVEWAELNYISKIIL